MTDLRRLAEQPGGLFIFKDKEEGGYELDVRQAILALLASRDMWADRANDYHRKRNAAERRVAALTDERLVEIIEQAIFETDTGLASALLASERIRALLASGSAGAGGIASPSEPLLLGQQVAIESHLPRDIQEKANTAALTSASAEAEGLPAEVGE